MYANTRGLRGKLVSLHQILSENRPHLFLLTETQLRSNTGINVKEYVFHGRKREGGTGGGVAILIREDIRPSISVHLPERNIEIIWVSIRRTKMPPVIIGTYYGKQESASKEEIKREMQLLNEEINERKKEGELILTMDGNAKIGLIGEDISRNGDELLKVINRTGLFLLNGTDKCKGIITRQNTNNLAEKSAIDFILASYDANTRIKHVFIDEEGLMKLKGKKDSDHNTIMIDLNIPAIEKSKPQIKTGWNINADESKWKKFNEELIKRTPKARDIITDPTKSMDERYKKFVNQIEKAAYSSIGKTTFKGKKKQRISSEAQALQDTKKKLKKDIQKEKDQLIKTTLTEKYKEVQQQLLDQLTQEKAEEISKKLEKITADGSMNLLWREKRLLTRNPTLEALVIKNDAGKRLYNPDETIDQHTHYFKGLFKAKEFPYHPYHTYIQEKMIEYTADRNHEDTVYNLTPTRQEITDIIKKKGNGKSTPDIKNEMLKHPGDIMTEFLYPLIETSFNNETITTIWNRGTITCLWKGKGDKEDLNNHRGITTSSSIGTIVESLIDNRIEYLVKFSQAQGGGKKGSSCCDHLFLLRAIIDTSLKEKRTTFVTFYDVSKAYDNVDNNDLLIIMWEKGLRGKAWRILKELSTNLTTVVNTRYGQTPEIQMEIGGKQGSRLTGRMFAKMMDLIAEELQETDLGFKIDINLIIAALLWVDDAITCTEGKDNQKEMLKRMDEFAIKHKLKWGQNKCNVMRIGKHDKEEEKWLIGDMEIKETQKYKYLGDVVTSDGKNTENIEARANRLQSIIININTFAAGEVLHRIESAVLLRSHDTITLSSLLTNAEAWNLTKKDEEELEKLEIRALKYLFDLPVHTPTVAIIFSFGLLYTTQRVDLIQLLYLQKILLKQSDKQIQRTLYSLKEKQIGWPVKIEKTLEKYNLPTDFETIKSTPMARWRRHVIAAIEVKNKSRIKDDLYKVENGESIPKTKTKTIIDRLSDSNYSRQPEQVILHMTKQDTKTLIMARYGMLDCGMNFKGTMSATCNQCSLPDNEQHRMNVCPKWDSLRITEFDNETEFDDIYKNDIESLHPVLKKIKSMWDTKYANGKMRI